MYIGIDLLSGQHDTLSKYAPVSKWHFLGGLAGCGVVCLNSPAMAPVVSFQQVLVRTDLGKQISANFIFLADCV